MLSFNQELKDEIVAEIIKHREHDRVVQGTYWDGEKGCAVGCAIHSLNLRKGKHVSESDHSAYEREFGIPMVLAKLEDRIFEGLSKEDCKLWPEQFMSTIPVNTNLSLVWPKFAVWLMSEVIEYAENKEVVQNVADLYSRFIAGDIPTKEEWRTVRNAAAAYAADAYAADAYAYAAAAYAADAYAADAYAYADAADAAAADAAAAYAADAYAAAADAYAAADAAAYAADAAAERQKYFRKIADKLLEILKNEI